MRKKLLAAGLAALLTAMPMTAMAAENPTCVLMKFTDDTRYDAIESAASLSDLVMEKMVASGRFNLKENRPIDENMESQLYNEKKHELERFEKAVASGRFTELFEGPGFGEGKAQSIAAASVGQIVTPAVTSTIGKKHGAEYLVQGTIVNLGTGNWWNEDYAVMSYAINMISSTVGSPIAGALSGALGPVGGILLGGGVDVKRTGVGVQADIRLIKAATGEVIWSKRVVGIGDQKQVTVGFIKAGSTKLNANLYSKGMDKAAQKIVDAMIADMDAGKLFVK